VRTLLSGAELTTGSICGADSYLMDAAALRRAVLETLRRDRLALVEPIAPRSQG